MSCSCATTLQVRSAGEDVADARIVTVDSTPPKTNITSSVDFSGATNNEMSMDSVTFSFEVGAASRTWLNACAHTELHTQRHTCIRQ